VCESFDDATPLGRYHKPTPEPGRSNYRGF